MSEQRLNYAVNLAGNINERASAFTRSIGQMAQRSTRSFTQMRVGAKELGAGVDSLGKKMETTAKYATVAAGAFTAWQAKKAIEESATLDKTLGQLKRTAGATTAETAAYREELIDMSKASGKSVETLMEGSQSLVASGLKFDQMRASMVPINNTMAVSEATASQLADALNAASSAFDFDLSNAEVSTQILDKMYVAGNAGRAEIQDLSGIFARVGGNAARANMSFDDTLAFIETLGQSGVPIGQLDTLADSTLRLFTNIKYLQDAQKATKVNFYETKGPNKGAKRAPQDVLQDISDKYKKLKTDMARDKFIQDAFGETDQDTKRGIGNLLGGDSLQQWSGINAQIAKATGAVAKDMPDALNNSIDQVERLKNTFRDATDTMAKPINKKLNETIQTVLDEKKLSGEELMVGGGALAATGLAATLLGGKAMRGIGGKIGGLAAGVATGKALEAAGGATPVYVVNMPSGGIGSAVEGIADVAGAGGGGAAGKVGKMAKMGRVAGAAGAVISAGAIGWEIGSLIHEGIAGSKIDDAIGSMIARGLALVGNQEAQQSLDRQRNFENQKIDLGIKVTADGRVEVQKATASDGTDLNVGNTTRDHM